MPDITTSFAQQYSDVVELLVQQLESHYKERVNVERIRGEAAFFDFIGEVSMQEKSTRNSKITYSETPHYRRRVAATYWYNAGLLDQEDKVRMLIDPAGEYARAFKGAAMRKIDDIIYDAARGTAYTGKTGSTAVSLPSTQKIVHGSTGMTVAKLTNALKIFLENDVDPDEERFITLSPADVKDLLNDSSFTSGDYNTLRPLMSGQVTKFMGFTFVPTNRVTTASSITYNIAWVRRGITLGIAQDIKYWVRNNKDYHDAVEFYIGFDMGAARMQEELVVEVQTYHA